MRFYSVQWTSAKIKIKGKKTLLLTFFYPSRFFPDKVTTFSKGGKKKTADRCQFFGQLSSGKFNTDVLPNLKWKRNNKKEKKRGKGRKGSYSSTVSKDIIQFDICIFHLHLRTHFNSNDCFILKISNFYINFIHHVGFKSFSYKLEIYFVFFFSKTKLPRS